jgi:hypothetical protein
VIVSGPFPVLVTAKVWAGLVRFKDSVPKLRLVGETLKPGTMPVPARLTVWGLPGALSLIVRVPLRAPTAVGVNVTLIVQVPLAATVPQLLVWEKSPDVLILDTVTEEVPVLVKVTTCGVLDRCRD